MGDLETPIAPLKDLAENGAGVIWVPPATAVLTPGHPSVRDIPDTPGFDIEGAGAPTSENPRARRDRLRIAALHGTPKQRVAFLLEEIFIRTPDADYVISAVERLLDHAKYLPNPGGLRIAAPGGMGKNALVNYFRHKYPSSQRGTKYCCPMLHVDFRGYPAPTDMLRTLLKQLHAIYTKRQHIDDLEDNLLSAMEECGNLFMVFNEAQHLVPVSKKGRHVSRLAGKTGDWLKGFLDRMKRPVILLGVQGWDEVFSRDPQLDTRVPHRCEFGCFKFDAVFVQVLRQLDEAIPMPEPAGFANKELAEEIFRASKGNWRRLTNLLADAILHASRRASARIERADMSSAYRTIFGSHDNPFETPGAP